MRLNRDVQIPEILNRLNVMVEQAKSVPFSKGAVIDRDEALDLLDSLRALLPDEISQADAILADRQSVLDDAQRKADDLLDDARRQVQRLLSENSLVTTAQHEVASTRERVEAELQRLREETDDYIDARLATFEVALARTMAAIQRGRERLHGKHPYDVLAPSEPSQEPELEHEVASRRETVEDTQQIPGLEETGPIRKPMQEAS